MEIFHKHLRCIKRRAHIQRHIRLNHFSASHPLLLLLLLFFCIVAVIIIKIWIFCPSFVMRLTRPFIQPNDCIYSSHSNFDWDLNANGGFTVCVCALVRHLYKMFNAFAFVQPTILILFHIYFTECSRYSVLLLFDT